MPRDTDRPLFSSKGSDALPLHPERDNPRGAFEIDDPFARATHTKKAVMTYLIVGLDLKTHAPWYENVSANDARTATRIARARAVAQGIDLVVAALIGPNSAVVSDSSAEWAAGLRAA
jgi:hypothetical protein